MKELMSKEVEEMIKTLERANSALARIFNVEESRELRQLDDGTPFMGDPEGAGDE